MRAPANGLSAFGRAAAGALLCLLGIGQAALRGALDLDDWVWRTPSPQGNPLVSVTWGAPGFVAVGGEGAVFTSADGITWSRRDPGTTAYLSGVTWAQDRDYPDPSIGRYVAVGSGGTILVSDFGDAWRPVDSGVGVWLRGVRWLPASPFTPTPTPPPIRFARAQGLFVAMGDEGTILTSPDGLTWTRRSSGVPPWLVLTDVALKDGVPEDRFVAVGDDGMAAISPDGFNWSVVPTVTTADLRGIAWSGLALVFVAVGKGGAILTSPDGLTWTARVSGTTQHLSCVAWGGSQFCALGDYGTILTSPDGVTWTVRSSGAVSYLRGLVWSGGRRQFCGVGDFGMIVTSYDGQAWAQQTAYTDVLSAVAWSGSQYCVVGDRGAVLTSVDGSIWYGQDGGTDAWLAGLAFGNGLFVAVGAEGTILVSADGGAWVAHASGTTAFLANVLWTGSRFLAAGEHGTILTSPDGTAWTAVPPATAEWYSDAAWSGGLYVVVGSHGTILTSPDALTWTRQDSGTGELLAAVTWAETQFVAVGSRGVVLTSPDGVTWTAQVSGVAGSLTDIVWSGTDLVAAGAAGTVVSSPDGVAWTQRLSRTGQWLHGLNWSGTQFTAVGSRGAISVCATSPATLPSPTWLALNLGEPITRDPAVLLYNTCSGNPTHYMASESPEFGGASWVPYLEAPRFRLSAGDGEKTVYLRVRDAVSGSESIWISDTILLDTTAPVPVLATLTPDPTRESPFAVTVSFSEPVEGFELGDVQVAGGSAADLVEEVAGQRWTFAVRPDRDGTVTVQVAASAAWDVAGNRSPAATPLVRLYDGTAPAIASLTPPNGATDVPRDATMVITLDEPVFAATGSIAIWQVVDGGLFETIPVDGPGVTVAGATVTIAHALFAAGGGYAVTVDQGSFTDAAGNPIAGVSGQQGAWAFTVVPWLVAFQAGPNGTLAGSLLQPVPEGGSTTPVTAQPDTGYHFARWTEQGAEVSTDNPLTVTGVTGDRLLTAEFELNVYTVTFTPGANGTLAGTTAQDIPHGGDATPVTAVANDGYHFARWTLAGAEFSTANPLTLTGITGSLELVAEFAINTFTVEFRAGTNGTLTGVAIQVVPWNGSTSPVTAVGDTGYGFRRWTEGGAVLGAANPLVLTSITADRVVIAEFQLNTYPVTFVDSGNGDIDGATAQSVPHGGATTPVTAVPDTGYHFLRWTLNGGPYADPTANPLTVTNVTGPMAFAAEFAINSYTIEFVAGANGSLLGATVQTWNYGEATSPVTAIPDFGYTFDSWSDGNTDNPRIVSPVEADLRLTATFRAGNPVAADGTFVTLIDAEDVAAGRGLWDFTGAYTVTVGAGTLRLNLVQDGRGRLTGTGNYSTTTLDIDLDPAKLVGAVKGFGNNVALKLHAAGKELEASGKREEVVVVDLLLTLNAAGRSLDGLATIQRGRRAPTGKTSSALNISLPLPGGMDGTYGIGWDLTRQDTRVAGDAVLQLSNGTQYLLGVSGKQAAAGAAARITAQADQTDVMGKGIRLQALLDTLEPVGQARPWWGVLSAVKGKALGQTLAW